jgi:hypothetical protein
LFPFDDGLLAARFEELLEAQTDMKIPQVGSK